MTIQVASVGSMRVIVESTFGADATASPGLASFTYVPFNESTAEVTLTTLEVDPLFTVQTRMQGREKVLGPRSATLKFTMDLAPTGTAAGSATAAVQGALGLLLKATMGGEHLGTGTTFASGWTAIGGNLTSGAGFLAGDFLGWTNAAGIVEWRQIKTLSTNAVTLSHGFSGSPAASDVAYAAANYYVTEDPATSLQFLVSGQESDDRWLLTGGQCVSGIAINIDPSGQTIPTIDFNFDFSWYFESDETAASVTGTLADATYTYYSPIVSNVGEYRMFTVGTPTLSTSSRIHISAETWAPKIEFTKVTSPSGANGGTVYRYRGSRINPPVEGSFTTFFEDLTWWQARDAKADLCMQRTIGASAGSAVILSAPTVQPLNPQRAASNEQIAGQVVQWAGRRNTDTAVTTDLALSPFIIALG